MADGADMPIGGALMPRATIFEIEAHRNRAVELYGQAWDVIVEAGRAAGAAAPSGVFDLPAIAKDRRGGFGWTDRAAYLADVTKQIDRGVWSHLIRATSLDKLMDAAERERFRQQCESDPPPATADNCLATMERLAGDAGLIFKRGIANGFSKLDRRFRSHDGFKIGARMVLAGAFSDWGSWNHYRRQDETLIDVERVFSILDGKPQPERSAGIVGAVETARDAARRASSMKLQPFEAESEHFRIRVFGNGNAHLWFKRKDLVERVNLLLADYYGAAVGASPDVADRHYEPARTPARNFGFFESPPAVVAAVLEAAGIYTPDDLGRRVSGNWTPAPYTVLEPSAGRGAIARACIAPWAKVTCVELQAPLAADLSGIGAFKVHVRDFLTLSPDSLLRTFDKIVMNPPFDRGRDVDHVTHALRFLAPGGTLVAVMSAGVEFRDDPKTVAFRREVERRGGDFRDLPPGSFAEAGTNVNTCLCIIKGGR